MAHHTEQTTTHHDIAVTFLQAQDQRQESANSRSILITAVENQEGVGLSEKVLLVQLVGAQLHGCNVLREIIVFCFPFNQVKINEETGPLTDMTGDANKATQQEQIVRDANTNEAVEMV